VSRRRAVRPPDLTSLFDVLFLFVFVSLVNAGVSHQQVERAEAAVAAARPAPPRGDLAGLRDRAMAQIATRAEVVARVRKDGVLTRVELADRAIAVDAPLVERVADPDVGERYLGEHGASARVCAVIAHAIGANDLGDYLVIIAPDAAQAELTVALATGLARDVQRCAADLHGVAVIVEHVDAKPNGGPHP